MKVILTKDVAFVGLENELVEVRNGFARNYLIPKKLAKEPSKANMAWLEAKKKIEQKKQAELLHKIHSFIETLEANVIAIPVKTGTSGRIFGRITSLQVVKAMKDQLGHVIDRKAIELPDMPTVGMYVCKLFLGNKKEHTAQIKINLVAEGK